MASRMLAPLVLGTRRAQRRLRFPDSCEAVDVAMARQIRDSPPVVPDDGAMFRVEYRAARLAERDGNVAVTLRRDEPAGRAWRT